MVRGAELSTSASKTALLKLLSKSKSIGNNSQSGNRQWSGDKQATYTGQDKNQETRTVIKNQEQHDSGKKFSNDRYRTLSIYFAKNKENMRT